MRLSSGSSLGPFEILAPLGAGGMGEVYRARDPNLGREVAIKVLPESLARDPTALARFRVEACALAALSHPNILGVFDFGSAAGVSFVVMELLEGETLRDKLKVGAPLPTRKAVEYAREIARGLSAAHAKGIVHRDLKPENIFVTSDERVKILDFGLAKRVAKATEVATIGVGPPPSQGTEPGIVVGTVGYMAPEQVRGLPIDHRADIFALGAILYELLTGEKAFCGSTPSDTMSAILRDEPAGLSQRGIPAGLARIVRYCLEKSPQVRAYSAQDVAFQLDTFASTADAISGTSPSGSAVSAGHRVTPLAAVAAVAVIAVIIAAIALWRQPAAAPARGSAALASAGHTDVTRLAVLPFENLGSTDDDYFADGITDEVRGKLTDLPGLALIARASSNGYRKTRKTPQEIGEELGVEYLLTGTVRFGKDASGARRVQVSPELVVAASAESKWTQPFDATLTDVFRVQGEIATKVAEALGLALSPGSRRGLEKKPTQSLAAYEAFLRGDAAWFDRLELDPPNLRRAIQQYERAVALDAGFVEAWDRLCVASSLLHLLGTPTPALAARAREAGEKALALAPERADGHRALSLYYTFVHSDGARALVLAERARALAPGEVHNVTAVALAEHYLGRVEAALEHLEEARRLDPRSNVLWTLGDVASRSRRVATAREAFDAALDLAPANLAALEYRAATELQEGDLAAARAVLRAAPQEVDPTALVAWLVAYRDLVWVLDDEQRALLLRLTPSAFDDDRGTWAMGLAQAYALEHDEPSTRKYAEIARAAYAEQLTAAPQDARRHISLGIVLAYLGRKEEAIREARRAVELLPVSKDAVRGPYLQHQLVRVYILTGEHEKAIDALEALLETPYTVTRDWLRIDPNFDPLRTNPRFAKLVGDLSSGTVTATR